MYIKTRQIYHKFQHGVC